MLLLLTLLLIEDNVSKQEIIVAEHDRRSQVRQNSVQQIDFVFQLFTIQRQLLKAGATNSNEYRLLCRGEITTGDKGACK